MRVHIDGIAKVRPTRKKRSGIMLCYPYESKRLVRWGSEPVFVQPKLDGERARLKWDPAIGWGFYSSTEELVNFAVPHLVERVNQSEIPHSLHLDGELYVHGWEFELIHSVVSRRTNLHEDYAQLEYYYFDCVEPETPQWARFIRLLQLRPILARAGLIEVPTYMADDEARIWEHNDSIVGMGYEGIVVRKKTGLWVPRRSTEVMKFKPKQQDVYRVIGAVQEIDKYGTRKSSLGALICEADGEQFNVATGFTQSERRFLWEAYCDNPELFTSGALEAVVKYQHITSGGKKREKGVPRFPVYVSLRPAS